MDFTKVVESVSEAKLAGRRYEREGHQKFRDCVTVCRNGRLKFERYCYGEAASQTCTMWAEGTDAEGNIQWDYDSTPYTGKHEAPQKLTGVIGDRLQFDDKRLLWEPTEDLKKVPGSGLSVFGGLFGKK